MIRRHGTVSAAKEHRRAAADRLRSGGAVRQAGLRGGGLGRVADSARDFGPAAIRGHEQEHTGVAAKGVQWLMQCRFYCGSRCACLGESRGELADAIGLAGFTVCMYPPLAICLHPPVKRRREQRESQPRRDEDDVLRSELQGF